MFPTLGDLLSPAGGYQHLQANFKTEASLIRNVRSDRSKAARK